MKIAIDLQGLQTPDSRNRGIGRYVGSLIEALLALPGPAPDYLFYANANLPAPELPHPWGQRIRTLPFTPDGVSRRNEMLLKTALLAEVVDAVFLPSPIEMKCAVVPDFQDFPARLYVISYDLIPLLFPDRYLGDESVKAFYMSRLRNLQHADRVLAISDATRRDTIELLKLPEERVVNIQAGVAPFFQTSLSAEERNALRKRLGVKFGIAQPFLFCNGGGDPRKNMTGLLSAFALLPADLQAAHQVVLTCRLTKSEEQALRDYARDAGMKSDALVLTNFVADDELKALYTLCKLFVFPSLYEGFGLPVVEAMACGAPVLAGNNSSLVELVPSPEHLVEAEDAASMASTLDRVLRDEDFRSRMAAAGPPRAAAFTWESVAEKSLPVLLQETPAASVTLHFGRASAFDSSGRERIACFSPFPPLPSGISDYSAELLPHLADHFHLDLYGDDGYTPALPNAESYQPHIRRQRAFERNLRTRPDCSYRALLYQMGNSDFHLYIYSLLRKYAGITVLHDYNLNNMLHWADRNRPDYGISYYEEMEHAYGASLARQIEEEVVSGRCDVRDLPARGIYTNRRIFSRSLGVIVHSRWAYARAMADHPDYCENLVRIPQQMKAVAQTERMALRGRVPELRRKWGIPEDAFVLGTFGFIAETKRPRAILAALKQFLNERPNAFVLFAGSSHLGADLMAEIARQGLTDHVLITGFVNDMEAFNECIALTDVCLSLRYPSNGETSSALLRILAFGKPSIVTNIGSFADYPEEVVYKVLPPEKGADAEVADLLTAFHCLAGDIELCRRMGEAAAAYVEREHAPARCAALYASFIQSVMARPGTRRRLLADYVARDAPFWAESDGDMPEPAALFAPFAAALAHGFSPFVPA